MITVNIIVFFLTLYYKKPRKGEEAPHKWFSALNIIFFSAIVMIAANSFSESEYSVLISVASIFPAAGLSYLILTQPEFEARKQVLYAWLPIIGIELISNLIESIAPAFYQKRAEYFDIAGIFAFIWAIAMWINNRKQFKKLEIERLKAIEKERELEIAAKLKAELEEQVNERTTELIRQKEELEKALENLKSTQDQLIHAEKMASLGELTAGIAHEIQNPLNFVNNFSEVSNELIQEIKEELDKPSGDRDQEMIADIFRDVADNLSKIAYHGKRADAIVKGMLQHSRTSSGVKELTDINEVADEYLRLAYHGLRAKDKTFNADFQTDFDDSLPKIEVISQDFGRVLLNLVNNAFYAVNEKKNKIKSSGSGEEYKPFVKITTRKKQNKIQIEVEDNGMGMPESVKQKIFQPFFTTKPTGQGTGLGMSLSYDIIKSHGGDIQVKSEDGKGTHIIIELPT